jgi:hypothetical protein
VPDQQNEVIMNIILKQQRHLKSRKSTNFLFTCYFNYFDKRKNIFLCKNVAPIILSLDHVIKQSEKTNSIASAKEIPGAAWYVCHRRGKNYF